MLNKSKIIMPSDEENEAIKRGIAADPEAYELTGKDFSLMRPASEVHPKLVEEYRKSRGKQKAPKKIATTIRFSADVLDYFKSTGKGWQTRMDEALRDYVQTHH